MKFSEIFVGYYNFMVNVYWNYYMLVILGKKTPVPGIYRDQRKASIRYG